MILILLTTLFAIWTIKFLISRIRDTVGFSKNFPGPSVWLKLPLIGHGYLLGNDPLEDLRKLKEKYGPIFRLDLGGFRTVIICDAQSLSEIEKTGKIMNRPYEASKAMRYNFGTSPKGSLLSVAFAHGDQRWDEQRKFMVQSLNALGLAKNDVLEGIVEDQVTEVIKIFEKYSANKQPLTVTYFFMEFINAVIWSLAFGYKLEENKLKKCCGAVVRVFDSLFPGNIINVLQNQELVWAKFFNWIGYDLSSRRREQILHECLSDEIKGQHPNPDGFFVEKYLAKMQVVQDPRSSFFGNEGAQNLLASVHDIFAGGTETISGFLEWILLYLCSYPDNQERIYSEVVNCCGKEGRVSLQDMDSIAIIPAFIQEIFRHSAQTSLGVPRLTTEALVVNGLDIPKNTQILVIGSCINRDPDAFPDPAEFRPERFIDENGRFFRDERIHDFGQGKRKCPGERFARRELFMFTGMIVQKFRLRLANPPHDFSYTFGLVFHPKPFDIFIEKRD